MKSPKFKVGDKVRVCNPVVLEVGDTIGVVTLIGKSIRVKWNTPKCIICGMYGCKNVVNEWYFSPHEIKHAVKVGEQLMFDFMEEISR